VNDLLAGNVTVNTRYYGMVDDTIGFMRGCAPVPGVVASGPSGAATGYFAWDTDGVYGDWYGAHELAHAFGRGHANFCGAEDGPSYPYIGGRISPSSQGDRAIFGFDTLTRAIYSANWHDLMTYCQDQWISDFTYEALLDRFQAKGSPLAGAPSSSAVDRLLVSGAIDPQTQAVTLYPLFVIPQAVELAPRVPGPYAIVLRAAGGSELARYPFTPTQMHGGPTLTQGSDRHVDLLAISELVPYVAGTVRVDIEGPGGAVLRSVTAGAVAVAQLRLLADIELG